MANNTHVIETVFKARDEYTSKATSILKKHSVLEKVMNKAKKSSIVIKATDKAIPIINKVKANVDKLKAMKSVQMLLKAKDQATKVISAAYSGAKKLAGYTATVTIKAKDMASGVINKVSGSAKALAMAGVAGAGIGVAGLASEETQKITINRVIQNSGKSKAEAKRSTDEYYKYLTEYANKTPFETSAVQQFGTKAMMISKGNIDNAKQYTGAMGNVKAFVGDLRTETEVAEAFFSASNGNMEMLNNMLGENYNTMDEAMAGIQKKQGGLVDEMSTTTGGLWSTLVGKSKDAMKNFIKVFETPLKGGMNNIIGLIDKCVPKVIGFFDTFSKSETANGLLEYFGTVSSTVFGMAKSVIDAVWPVVSKVFNFFVDRLPLISSIVESLGTIWGAVWPVVGKLLEKAWGVVSPILDFLFKAVDKVLKVVIDLGKWWKDTCDKINKNPIVATVKQIFTSNNGGNGNDGRNAFGSGRIARDGELHTLHQGEKVLTKQQANQYDKRIQGENITINMSGITVNNGMDIKEIANTLVTEIKKAKLTYGGVY